MKEQVQLRKLLPCLEETVAGQLAERAAAGAVVLRKARAAVPEEILEGERAVIRYISTRDVDRDGEVLVPKGVDLTAYQVNSIVLFAHNYSNPPHARAEWVRVDDYGVRSKTVYAETERAEELWQLVKGGFLNAASVGFLPSESVVNGGPGWAETVRKLARAWDVDPDAYFGQVKTIFTKWTLLEYSDVPIPSNPAALIEARAKGLRVSDGLVRELGLAEDSSELEAVEKPYPNEHACRLRDPGDFQSDSFRRTQREHEGKQYFVIMGRLRGQETMTEQAYRYPKDTWTADAARGHCRSHDGRVFEPASGERSICLVCGGETPERIVRPLASPKPEQQVRLVSHVRPVLTRTDISAIIEDEIAKARGRP